MKCKVKISGNGEYWCVGEIERGENGFKLSYYLDGDECSLDYAGGRLTQKRRGNLCMEITFSEGAETSCRIEDGGLSGMIPVYTNSLTVSDDCGKIEIAINYDFGGERVLLSITAEDFTEF